jgi:hypothetical protein
MAHLINMEIAGINFTVTCNNSIILRGPGPAYQPFLEEVNKNPRVVDIHIRLELEGIPDTENLTKIFESDLTWTMLLDGDTYLLTFSPPGLVSEPIWLAMLSNPVSYPLDQILLMYILARRQGALIHAAGIDINGRCYIFPGKSGAGKSTITRQFAALGDTALLSDDRIVVRKIDGGFKAFGTPWPGEAGIALNKSEPLASIFFINHGSANRIKEITPQEALARLLPVTSIPWYDREVMDKILTFCEDLISSVPIYELDFRPSIEVVFQPRHNGHAEEARQEMFETEALTIFEDILENGLSLRVRVTGLSMTPFLKGGEILTIRKEPHDALRKGDLIFFKSSQGVPLLHRIIQKRGSPDEKITFRTKGDGLIAFDEPVEYHRVLGKVSRIEKTNSVPGS